MPYGTPDRYLFGTSTSFRDNRRHLLIKSIKIEYREPYRSELWQKRSHRFDLITSHTFIIVTSKLTFEYYQWTGRRPNERGTGKRRRNPYCFDYRADWLPSWRRQSATWRRNRKRHRRRDSARHPNWRYLHLENITKHKLLNGVLTKKTTTTTIMATPTTTTAFQQS